MKLGLIVKSLESSQKTERRRKRLVAAAGAAVGVVLLVVAWSYWRTAGATRRVARSPQAAKTLPAHAEQQLSGYSFTRSMGGRRLFTVHAAKTIAFEPAAAGGATVLQDIWVEFFGSEGDRRDVLRTAECKYNPRTGELAAEGKVDMVLNADSVSADSRSPKGIRQGHPPVFIETSNVSFEQPGSLLVSEEPVEFRVGGARGHARGLRYDMKEGWLELASNVTADFPFARQASDRQTGSTAHLTARRLRYDKSKGDVKLWGPVAMTQGKQGFTAAEGEIRLDARHRVAAATLSGGVEGRGVLKAGEYQISAPTVEAEFGPDHRLQLLHGEGGVQGQIRGPERTTSMTSQTLEVKFSGNPPAAVEGNASGSVRMTSTTSENQNTSGGRLVSGRTASGPSAGQVIHAGRDELTADRLNFSFQPGGRLLKEARTEGPGSLVFYPVSPKQGEREVNSTPLVMTFDSRGQLAGLEGLSHCQMVFHPPARAADRPTNAPDDVTTSDRFKAVFDPATKSLKYLDEFGNVRFHEGERQASADRAHYDPATDAVELLGKPLLWDPGTRISADRIFLDFDDGTFEGQGHVQATELGGTRQPANSDPDADPTHVVAERVTAERNGGSMQYTGHVRAWHGASVLESSELDISKAEREISSPKRVVTSHLAEVLQPRDPKTKGGSPACLECGGEATPAVISADRMEYFDQERRATYRGNVVMESQGTTVTADALEVYFAPAAKGKESEIERAVGSGHVLIVRATRRGTGDRAEYWAQEGKIELTGGPPALWEAGDDYVTGRRLTFFLADDTVFVDGDARSPTYSKHRIPK